MNYLILEFVVCLSFVVISGSGTGIILGLITSVVKVLNFLITFKLVVRDQRIDKKAIYIFSASRRTSSRIIKL